MTGSPGAFEGFEKTERHALVARVRREEDLHPARGLGGLSRAAARQGRLDARIEQQLRRIGSQESRTVGDRRERRFARPPGGVQRALDLLEDLGGVAVAAALLQRQPTVERQLGMPGEDPERRV